MGMETTVQGTVTTLKVKPGETIIIKAGSNKIQLTSDGITISGKISIIGVPSVELKGPTITADQILVG